MRQKLEGLPILEDRRRRPWMNLSEYAEDCDCGNLYDML
jgi:hypothetical protein